MSKIRVFLADDHEVVRHALKMLIIAQPDMEVVGESGNGHETCRKAGELKPDVLVMDIAMPRVDGVAATEIIKQECSSIRVLGLTAIEDMESLSRLLRAGASGYVLKRSAADELTRAIRLVTRGEVYLDPALGKKIAGRLAMRGDLAGKQHLKSLTSREEEILRLVAWGYSNKEIAAKLSLSVKTVETHKSRSMEKLGLRGRTDVVRFAVRQGWLSEE